MLEVCPFIVALHAYVRIGVCLDLTDVGVEIAICGDQFNDFCVQWADLSTEAVLLGPITLHHPNSPC